MATKTTDTVGVPETPSFRRPFKKTIARITGLLFILISITAGFSEGFVRESMLVLGAAATTGRAIGPSPEITVDHRLVTPARRAAASGLYAEIPSSWAGIGNSVSAWVPGE